MPCPREDWRSCLLVVGEGGEEARDGREVADEDCANEAANDERRGEVSTFVSEVADCERLRVS